MYRLHNKAVTQKREQRMWRRKRVGNTPSLLFLRLTDPLRSTTSSPFHSSPYHFISYSYFQLSHSSLHLNNPQIHSQTHLIPKKKVQSTNPKPSRGLGAVIAQKFAAEGSNIAINYYSRIAEAEELSARLEKEHGVKTIVIQGNISISVSTFPHPFSISGFLLSLSTT